MFMLIEDRQTSPTSHPAGGRSLPGFHIHQELRPVPVIKVSGSPRRTLPYPHVWGRRLWLLTINDSPQGQLAGALTFLDRAQDPTPLAPPGDLSPASREADPSNSYVEVLTPGSQNDLIWKWGPYRCNWLR